MNGDEPKELVALLKSEKLLSIYFLDAIEENDLKTNIKKISGNWDLGFALDKHTLKSEFIGNNEFGHPQFHTTRTEAGEAIYQLKYRYDSSLIEPLAQAIVATTLPYFDQVGFVIPVPATNHRPQQPVYEIAKTIATKIKVPYFDGIVVKLPPDGAAVSLKNLVTKEQKTASLNGRLRLEKTITNDGCWNVLVVDDLFDTGATLEAVCQQLTSYEKVGKIFVATLTWK